MALPWAASCLPLRGGKAPTDSWYQPVSPSARQPVSPSARQPVSPSARQPVNPVNPWYHLWQRSGLSPLPRARIDVWFFLKEPEDGSAVESGAPEGHSTPAHGNAVGHPHQKIRPARAHQNGPGPSQWGRRYEGAPGGLNANTGAFPRRCQGLRVGCPCEAKKAPDMGHIWYEPFRFPYDSRRREGAPGNLPAAAALLVHPTRTPARTGNPGAWSKGLASIPRESSASPRGGEGPQVPTGAGCGGRTGGCAANSNAPPHTET
jgi:hypothetical protein